MNPEIVILPIMFAMIFGVVYVYFTTQHRQRMALIEKGQDPNIIHSFTGLRLGYLSIGVGAGVAIGWFAHTVMFRGVEEGDNPAPFFIAVLVCGGFALIMAHKRVAEARKQMIKKSEA